MSRASPRRLSERPRHPPPQRRRIVRELRAFQWNGRPTKRAITSVGLAKSAADRRRDVRQRVLDEQAARRAQPPRGVVSRVLQAAAAALLHRSLHRARRRRVRPVHGTRHDGHRSGAGGTNARGMRHQSAERDARAAAPVASDGRTRSRRRLAALDLSLAVVVSERARGLLPPRHAARNLRAARISARARPHADRSTASIGGFGWWRSTG